MNFSGHNTNGHSYSRPNLMYIYQNKNKNHF